MDLSVRHLYSVQFTWGGDRDSEYYWQGCRMTKGVDTVCDRQMEDLWEMRLVAQYQRT